MEVFLLIGLVVAAIWFFQRPSPAQPAPPASTPIEPPTTAQRQQAHLRAATEFTKERTTQLAQQKAASDTWKRKYGYANLEEIDGLSGVAFEEFLAGMLRERGYAVETTPASGDFGADLLLSRGEERIAVQAKRWREVVGVGAVQEVVAAMGHYGCRSGWVITNSRFTPQARILAESHAVTLIDRPALALWLGERARRP